MGKVNSLWQDWYDSLSDEERIAYEDNQPEPPLDNEYYCAKNGEPYYGDR